MKHYYGSGFNYISCKSIVCSKILKTGIICFSVYNIILISWSKLIIIIVLVFSLPVNEHKVHSALVVAYIYCYILNMLSAQYANILLHSVGAT